MPEEELELVVCNASGELEPLKRNARLVKDSTKLLLERTKLPSSSQSVESVKDVVKQRPNVSKKLFALGTALLIMPDPITDAASVPVFIAAKIAQSKQSSNVKDVYEEMRQTMKAISSISSF